jgi:Methyltransferase domain
VPNAAEVPNSSSVLCKVCNGASSIFGLANVLRKYPVSYFRCATCGFIQTENPYWLHEAYSAAIASQDVGIMQRNLVNCEVTSAILTFLFPNVTRCVDVGAGHGVFVRLMRDRGFNFFWSDRYATNDYARGFESPENTKYDFLTAFEVLEHLVDPIQELSDMMSKSDNVFVSTCLVPEPVPEVPAWWYYMPDSGQHISFFTLESLRRLATRFGSKVLSVGPYHLFTKNKINTYFYRLSTNFRYARLLNMLSNRRSLIEQDFQQMTR